MELSADLQELVDRRGALRARMLELRASAPEDHDGFLRTVDQLLAVSDRIVELVSAPPEAPVVAETSGPEMSGPEMLGPEMSDPERVPQQGAPGAVPDHGG